MALTNNIYKLGLALGRLKELFPIYTYLLAFFNDKINHFAIH